MFDERGFMTRMRRFDSLEQLAEWEEFLAQKHGGHHEPLARMIRSAIAGRGPRQQLSLFPGTTKPRTK